VEVTGWYWHYLAFLWFGIFALSAFRPRLTGTSSYVCSPERFYPDHRNFSEAFFKSWRFSFGSHALDHVLFYLAFTLAVSLQTNFKWNIEKRRHVPHNQKPLSHLDPLAALMRSQIAGNQRNSRAYGR